MKDYTKLLNHLLLYGTIAAVIFGLIFTIVNGGFSGS